MTKQGWILAVAALAWFAASPTVAVDLGAFQPRMLKHSGDWDSRNDAWPPMIVEIMRQTSIVGETQTLAVDATKRELFDSPFLMMSGSTAFEAFSEKAIENLSRWLRSGGLLFIDNTQGALGAGFDQSVRRMVGRAFPGKSLGRIGRDHVLFQTFFLLKSVPGRMIYKPDLEGIWLDDRTPILYSRNDISGAWMRDALGNWYYAVTPGGRTQRDYCFRFGINLAMYALAVNYKKDQVHIPFIIQRRR